MNKSASWWLTTLIGAVLAAWQFAQSSGQAEQVLGQKGLFWGGLVAAALSSVLGATHQGRKSNGNQ